MRKDRTSPAAGNRNRESVQTDGSHLEQIKQRWQMPVVLISGVGHKVPIYSLTGYLSVTWHFLHRIQYTDWERDTDGETDREIKRKLEETGKCGYNSFKIHNSLPKPRKLGTQPDVRFTKSTISVKSAFKL